MSTRRSIGIPTRLTGLGRQGQGPRADALPHTVLVLCVVLLVKHAAAEVRENLKVVAEQGQLGIVEFDPLPSINDDGFVAVIGRSKDANRNIRENVFCYNPLQDRLIRLMPEQYELPNAGEVWQTFGPGVQVSNTTPPGVVTRRLLRSKALFLLTVAPLTTTYIESWTGTSTGLPFQLQMGTGGANALTTIINPPWGLAFPSPLNLRSQFEGVFEHPSVNRFGGHVFTALDNDVTYLATSSSAGNFIVQLDAEHPRPQFADNNETIMRLGTNRIVVLPPAFFPFTYDTGATYSAVGRFPGMADAGNAIAYVGRQDDVTSVVLVLRNGGSFDTPLVVANNAPGDQFAEFDFESRVGVNYRFDPSGGDFNVVFVGTSAEGRKGLYTSWITPTTDPPSIVATDLLIETGDKLPGVDGTVTDLRLYDPAGSRGQVCSWVKTTSSSAIVGGEATGVQVLDYNDESFRVEVFPELFPELVRLSDYGRRRTGFVADGVTPLLLRSRDLPDGGDLRITVKDEFGETSPERVGVLRDAIDDTLTGNPIEVPVRDIPDRPFKRAFAILTSPVDFVREGLEDVDEPRGRSNPRILTIETQYLPPGGPPGPVQTQPLELHRPPVVLVHGLFDRGSSWSWSLLTDPRFAVFVEDYEDTHDWGFLDNILGGVPRDKIQEAIERMRSERIAATQVDAFGHSMGGILLRLYSMDEIMGFSTWYRRFDNFDEGDIHKLVTVNTPHLGSQVSHYTVTADNQIIHPIADFFRPAFANVHCDPLSVFTPCEPCRADAGAVRDLRVDSEMTRFMNETRIERPPRVHAIFGESDTDTSDHCYARRMRAVFDFSGCPNALEVFGGANDSVVSVSSQRGGLPGSGEGGSPEPVFRISGDEGLHWPTIGEFSNGPSAEHAIRLLNARVSSGYFAEGFPTNVPYEFPPPEGECVADYSEGLVDFCYQVPETVGPGTAIEITVCLATASSQGPGLELTEAILIDSYGNVVFDDTPPLKLGVTVPISAAGFVEFDVYAKDASGAVHALPVASTLAVPEASLTSLSVEPRTLEFFDYRSSKSVTVLGQYDDDVLRDISAPETGTVYTVDDQRVATVSLDGIVTARNVGATVLTVQNGDAIATSEIVVHSAVGDWDGDGLRDLADYAAFNECVTGPHDVAGFTAPTSDCADAFDQFHDGDVDLLDWSMLVLAWDGAPPGP